MTSTMVFLLVLKRMRQAIVASCFFLPAFVPAGRCQPEMRPQPRIAQAIDDSKFVELKGNIHPLAKSSVDMGAADGNLALDRMILVLKRSPAQETALRRLIDAQKNPKSASYRQWLTPEQFGARFGLAPQDEAKITHWLLSHGFTVEPAAKSHDVIIFSGSNTQLQETFHTQIHRYKSNGASNSAMYANAVNPSIPVALADTVAGIARLNNIPLPSQHKNLGLITRKKDEAKWQASGFKLNPFFNTPLNGYTYSAVGPTDLAAIYNIQPLWDAGIDGSDQTIALVGRSDINPDDVDSFRSFFGLPAKKLNLIYYGTNPGLVSGDEGEADLDVEWSGAVAKNATIDLVVAASTNTTDGIFLSAQYIVDNNLAPVMSMSFGECELAIGTAGNQLIEQMWEQAAAQGITVMVSTGDSGSAGCDQNNSYAKYGLAVNGLASTPYNIAVGGTDLYGTYTDNSKYWNSTNDPVTQASAKSYIPELPWNDSCANPQYLTAIQSLGIQDQTLEDFCNDSANESQALNTGGGSGGPSSCIGSSGGNPASCTGGYAKPSWQSAVPGNPADSVRDIPDVSLFAGNGLWGSFYVYCESDVTADGTCDLNSSDDVQYLAAGGTSFAAPSFAGIMALVNQKTGSPQGNANVGLYKLAGTQFAGSGASACDSSIASGGNACLFYDVSQGSNAVPCLAGTTDCTVTNQADYYGVLPGWDATVGYDTAVGLGTVNAANLVNGWSSASATFTPTTTTLQLAATSLAYGTPITGTITVASDGKGTPDGDTSLVATTATNGFGYGPFTLDNGSAAISANGATLGTHTFAGYYAGDSTFAGSKSTSTTITITQAGTLSTLSASRPSVTPGESDTFSVVVSTKSEALSPTGTITFTDTTSGSVLGSVVVVAGIALDGTSNASASVNLNASQLSLGGNTIAASYSGDTNYGSSTGSTVTVNLLPLFQLAAAPTPLSVSSGGSAVATVTLTSNAGVLPAPVVLSCASPIPAGLSCVFNPAVIGAGSATGSTTLTVHAVFPTTASIGSHASGPAATLWSRGSFGLLGTSGMAATLSVAFLLFPGRRRRVWHRASSATLLLIALMMGACGGTKQPVATTTVLSASAADATQGTTLVFTAKVSATKGSEIPTGTVTFTSGSSTLGTGSIVNGSATFSTSSLPLGSNSVIASYSGDTDFLPSVSAIPVTADVEYPATLNIAAMDSLGNTTTTQLPVVVK